MVEQSEFDGLLHQDGCGRMALVSKNPVALQQQDLIVLRDKRGTRDKLHLLSEHSQGYILVSWPYIR